MAKNEKVEQEDQFVDIREEATRNAARDAENRSVGKTDEEEKHESEEKPTELPNNGK